MTLLDKHQEAQEIAAHAAHMQAVGKYAEAIELYSHAAELEEIAYYQVPESKPRTRGIFAVSVASLYYKAKRFDEAERFIFRQLAGRSVPSFAEVQLRELLEVIWDERILHEELSRRYTGEDLTISMRGGQIGTGTGPLDLILQKVGGFRSLLCRFAEWIGDFPFRISGNPPAEITTLFDMRATQPAAGSFRVGIRFTQPSQRDLFDEPRVSPAKVSEAFFEFIGILSQGSAEELANFVPDRDYRTALLQLVRNIAPGGNRVHEIAIYRRQQDRIQSAYLTHAVRARVREVMPRETPSEGSATLQGVLRALHLDRNWLEITLPDGSRQKCDTVPEMLDDVVGPMVNHKVIISGSWINKSGYRRLLVEDIEMVEDGDGIDSRSALHPEI